jgi:TolB-like protein
MRYALISNTLLFLVAFGAALSPLAWGQSRRSVRRPVQHKPMRQAPPPPVSIGISSFRQTVGTTETESLGIGITDSLANALKGSANLAVAGPEVLFAASEKQDIDPSKNDENAVRVSSQLGLMMIVVGSYQHVGNQLIVDGRILNVQTGAALPGSSVSVSAKYPEEYSALLTQLATRFMTALRLPEVPGQAQKISATSMSSSSPDALRLYNQGLKRMAEGTGSSFEAAIGLFTECLNADPAYSLAYAARADAENRLIESSKAVGDDKEKLAQSALSDAQQAVKARPNLPRAQTALAQAGLHYDRELRSRGSGC